MLSATGSDSKERARSPVTLPASFGEESVRERKDSSDSELVTVTTCGNWPSGESKSRASEEFQNWSERPRARGSSQISLSELATMSVDGLVAPRDLLRLLPESLSQIKNLLRGTIFKADKPMRFKVGYWSTAVTSAAGGVNAQVTNGSLASCSEWTSIGSLWDEVFVHSLTMKCFPRNRLDSAFVFTPTAQVSPVYTTTGANTTSTIWNAQLICCSHFNGASAYANADAMLNNPNHKIVSSGKPWKYTWRNNVRYDPHGLAVSATNFQGWTIYSDVAAKYGGLIQVRAAGDVTIGTGASSTTLGDIALIWDISLRCRS